MSDDNAKRDAWTMELLRTPDFEHEMSQSTIAIAYVWKLAHYAYELEQRIADLERRLNEKEEAQS